MDGKPIANKYCEGKMKRTLKRGLKDLKSLRRKVRKLANVRDALRKRSWMHFMLKAEPRKSLSVLKTESGLLLMNRAKSSGVSRNLVHDH